MKPKLNLSWWQRLALRGLLRDGNFEKWLRERALNLPAAKKTELQARLRIKLSDIEAVQTALQDEALHELSVGIG